MARMGKYDYERWNDSSLAVLRVLESAGVHVEINGIEHIKEIKTPFVLIGNHMSFLETVLLPIMIVPYHKITYILKESLFHYPVFKHIIRSRKPIGVTRTNPRKDLKAVMGQGVERLREGISIIVFPQTTRSHDFDPKQHSTIGVKLARKAGIPIVPLALKTDALRNGKIQKDFGKLDPSRKVFFSFGQPLMVQGRGHEEHQAILDFIGMKLDEWKDQSRVTPTVVSVARQ